MATEISLFVFVENDAPRFERVDINLKDESRIVHLRRAVKKALEPVLDFCAAADLVVKTHADETLDEDALMIPLLERHGSSKINAFKVFAPRKGKDYFIHV